MTTCPMNAFNGGLQKNCLRRYKYAWPNFCRYSQRTNSTQFSDLFKVHGLCGVTKVSVTWQSYEGRQVY